MELPPKQHSLPHSPFLGGHQWEPVIPLLQGHTESTRPVTRPCWPAAPEQAASCHHVPRPKALLPRHAPATPPKCVSSACPLPGAPHTPALGRDLSCETEINPFEVRLPTPSQLPAKNAGDFSLSPATDKSQIVPVALFEVADTSVWLRAPSLPGPSSGYVGNQPFPRALGVSGIPRGPAATIGLHPRVPPQDPNPAGRWAPPATSIQPYLRSG